MAVTYGFYNSVNGDRKYDARQMAAIFDGIITDGVYQSIGSALMVKATTGMQVAVGTGRAWFNKTWTLNDAVLPLALSSSDIVLNRIDAIVLEVDSRDASRANKIRAITGSPAANPQRPIPMRTDTVNQYALAYVYVKAGAQSIAQADITNSVGLGDTPFVTGVLKGMNIDDLIAQWGSQWSSWLSQKTSEADGSIASWISSKQTTFDSWFSTLQNTLSTNQAAALAAQILELQQIIQTFATEQTIYRPISDSNGNDITDSGGNKITGRLVYDMK